MLLAESHIPLRVLYGRVGALRPPAESTVAFSMRRWTTAALSGPFKLRLSELVAGRWAVPFSLCVAPSLGRTRRVATAADAGKTTRLRSYTGLTWEPDVRATKARNSLAYSGRT
jgi:hypothetical protein